MWWQAFLWALAAAVVLGLGLWLLKMPQRKQSRKVMDGAMHRLILSQTHGYTLRLLDESGEEIAVLRHWQFTPRIYSAGSQFAHASLSYEIVSVEDDYPAASGTLVLRRAPE